MSLLLSLFVHRCAYTIFLFVSLFYYDLKLEVNININTSLPLKQIHGSLSAHLTGLGESDRVKDMEMVYKPSSASAWKILLSLLCPSE